MRTKHARKACGDLWGQSMILKVVPGNCPNLGGGWVLHFIRGKELLFNVLLCQEITRGYNKKKISPMCIIKIDLKKVYDFLNSEFMYELLTNPKFLKEFFK